MIPALLTSGSFLAVNLVAWAVSLHIERHGLPDHASAQVAARKPGDLRRRTPLILFNLVALVVGSFVGVWMVTPLLDTGWPGMLAFAAQFAVIVLVDDLVFYAVHRALHAHPVLYQRLHARHHQAYAPLPIELLYTHPGETSLVTLGIVASAGVLWAVWGAVSFPVLLAYAVFRHLHELDMHSGLRSRLAHHIPLLAPNEHHDLHHHRPHVGNFASMLTLWDDAFGTRVIDRRKAPVVPVQEPRRRAA